jgi:hypothetical protein
MNPLKLPQNAAKQAVIEGILPKYPIEVFNIPFIIHFIDTPSAPGAFAQLHYFEQIISCKGFSGKEFVKDLPPIFYQEIIRIFCDIQPVIGAQLLQQLDEFLETDESRNYWELFKITRPELVVNINERLNFLQRKWILVNVQKDKQDTVQLIGQIFDAIKPWLNSELYQRVQEVEESQRENVFYDDANIEKIDARIRAKAKKFKQSPQKLTNDLDEISIDEGK